VIERTLDNWRALPHLTVKEASEVIGVSESTVRRAMDDGELTERRLLGRRFVVTGSVICALGENHDLSPANGAKSSQQLTREDRRIVSEMTSLR
jgi:excisionase family DNA binding protein